MRNSGVPAGPGWFARLRRLGRGQSAHLAVAGGQPAAVIITAEQRDVLYDHFLSRLLAAGDLATLIQSEDFDVANRFGRELADELRLVIDDLGWGDGYGRPVQLTLPASNLRWLFTELQKQARIAQIIEAREHAEMSSQWEQTRVMNEVCDQVLAAIELEGGEPGGDLLTERTPQH